MRLLSRLLDRMRPPAEVPPSKAPSPTPTATRPEPPPGASNYVIVTLDSCRFDSFVKAKPKHMARLGAIEKRYTYATWTSPSHYNLLIGLLPHVSPAHVYASEYYKDDFLKFKERFNVAEM